MTWPRINATQPAYGSWLDTWARSHSPSPHTFQCGVRVVAGELDTASHRWRFRTSAVDPLIEGGHITLHHGAKTKLRLRVWPDPIARGPRPRHVILEAVEPVSGANLEVSAPFDELYRFGLQDD